MSLRYYLDGVEIDGDRIWFPQTGLSMTQAADGPETAVGGCVIDDPDGDWDITGWKPFYVEEDACSVPRMWTGFVAGRSIGRGSHRDGSARIWNVDLLDLNVLLSTRMLRLADAKRPYETEVARMAWLLGSHACDGLIFDNGLINTAGGQSFTEADFRGQFAYDVLGSMGSTAKNAFVYWDAAADPGEEVSLYWDTYDAANLTSSLRISNDLDDIDGTVTFAPYVDATLARDPSDVYSGVLLRWRDNETWGQNATTITNFIDRDTLYTSDRIGRASTATNVVSSFLAIHSVERDTVTCTVLLPRDKVNLIIAGDRVSVKFTHLPGYESFGYARVVRRTVRQGSVADFYEVDLELAVRPTQTPVTPPAPNLYAHYEAYSVTSWWGHGYSGYPTYYLPAGSTYGLIFATLQASTLGSPGYTYTGGSPVEIDTVLQDISNGDYQYVAIVEYLGTTWPTPFYGEMTHGGAAVSPRIVEFVSSTPFTRVQYAQAQSDTVVLGSDPTAGSLLILSIAVGSYGATNAIPTPTGWTETNADIDPWWRGFRLRQFYKVSVGAADKTTTISHGGAGDVVTSIVEYDTGGGTPIITTNTPPPPGLRIYNEIVTPPSDGSTYAFSVAWPFVDGTLRVRVDQLDQTGSVSLTDPAAGTFELSFIPKTGELVTADYQVL